MRFRSRISKRQQQLLRSGRRTTFAVAGFGLLLLVVQVARMQNSPQQPAAASPDRTSIAPSSLLQSDEFRTVPSESFSANASDVIDRAGAAALEAGSGTPSSATEYAPDSLTADVRDDVLGVLASETTALFGTLKLAQKVFPEKFRQMPLINYPVIMTEPSASRGRPFLLRGKLRRLTAAPLPQSANSWGIRAAWDAWISTPDSGNQLVHVLALTADAGLPITDSTGKSAPEIELGGYFFKREGYAAKGPDGTGDLALTPLFLSDRLRLIPPVVAVSRAEELRPWLTWTASILSVTVIAIIMAFRSADRLFKGTRAHQLIQPPVRPGFDSVEAVTVQQALAAMEQHARENSLDTSLLPTQPPVSATSSL
ncbi:MAG: hypothetical protein RLZZ458_1399 [Planctomycetota bacterium]